MPPAESVVETTSLTETERRVSTRLAGLRRESGLTLQEVSEGTGLSISYLSRVENGRAAISVANLAALAEFFCVPIGHFFEAAEEPPRRVLCRAGEGRHVRLRGRRGILVRMLALAKADRVMEPFVADVGTLKADMPMQAHPGQELIHILEGGCRFDYDGEETLLEEGDSILFDASVPHRVRALARRRCRFLAVVSAGDRRFHGDIIKVLEERIQPR